MFIISSLYCSASFGGFLDIVNLLLDYKADGRPNADSGITPLYAACYKGHFEVAEKLIQVFPKQITMPVTLEETYPLHAAIINGHFNIINLLLKHRQLSDDVVVITSRKVSAPEKLKKKSSTVSNTSLGKKLVLKLSQKFIKILNFQKFMPS